MKQDDILPGMPDALSQVPPKAREYEALTLDEAIRKAHALADEVIAASRPEHVVVLYSGGEDSVVLAHLMRHRVSEMAHVNTGIAVPETAIHVRAIAQAWGMKLHEATPPRSYEDLVLGRVLNSGGNRAGEPAWIGFPGPAAHDVMYQRLKERALRQLRRQLVGKSRGRAGQVVYLAGQRWGESRRRFRNASEFDREGAVTWCSPLVWWTDGHMREYRDRYRCRQKHQHAEHLLCAPDLLPRNEVTVHLHMSGDCLCGSFAQEGEIQGLELFYPSTAARLHNLEKDARQNPTIPAERCTWGWGAGREAPSAAGRLCARCVPPQIPGQQTLELGGEAA